MPQAKVRYLKLLVYEGPRDVIEEHIKYTLFGTKWQSYHGKGLINGKELIGDYSITGYSLVAFPEILIPVEDVTENNIEFK